MEAIASIRKKLSAQETSLVETVSRLCGEFSAIQKELEDTRSENNRLRTELESWRSRYHPLPSVDTSSLRRSVAYYCHPDRGGSTDLMSKLNVIFDFISTIERPQNALSDSHHQGRVQ